MMVKLLVVDGSTNVKEVTLRRIRTVAGRKKGCKLRIRSELVSRIHCSLIRDGSRLSIKDLGSSNGTYVNGVRVSEAALQSGDTIQIGPVKFVVQMIGVGPGSSRTAGEGTQTVKLPDGNVVFCETDEEPGEEVIEADLLEELDDDDVEIVTAEDSHEAVSPDENIFGLEDGHDATKFRVVEDDQPGGSYRVADPPG
jgi:pSer/pThr/pTyr-binding forkhead associated (FHA) protein